MAEKDTAIQAGGSRFPQTAWSLLSRLRDPKDPRVQEYLNRMMQMYWRPIYKYVRIAWKRTNEDAKDLTQAFFIHLLEGDLLARADPERGNFRKLLMAALRNFLANEVRAGHAQKRGGGRMIVSLDVAGEEQGTPEPSDPKEAFESQWAKELLERAIEKLSRTVRGPVFAAFRRFHLEDGAVRDIARELKATEAQIGHYLQDARTVLRRLVMDEIREYVNDETEIARELDELFKGWR
jgi:RNA polymerase sigma-70 factor (ECF subfamily)